MNKNSSENLEKPLLLGLLVKKYTPEGTPMLNLTGARYLLCC